MIEIKNKLFTQRLYSDTLEGSDFFKAVFYGSYSGDESKIPFYYIKRKGTTAIQDLSPDLETILAKMKSNTRNEVRRAIKENCTFSYNRDYAAFVEFYNLFADDKKLPRIVENQVKKYGDTVITVASHDNIPIAMHATVVSKENNIAFLLFSCSPRLEAGVDPKLIGWANRFLHYKDFEYIKELGITRYDWCGVVTDPEKKETFSIGRFKLSFGGELCDVLDLKTPLFAVMTFVREIRNKILTR